MIAVDTNVLVRIVTNDNPEQAARAVQSLQKKEVFIAKTVLLEMEWVLRHAYELNREAILTAFRSIFALANSTVEDTIAVQRAIGWYEQGLDFADALHLASSQHTDRFLTFDDRLCKKAKSYSEITVVRL